MTESQNIHETANSRANTMCSHILNLNGEKIV